MECINNNINFSYEIKNYKNELMIMQEITENNKLDMTDYEYYNINKGLKLCYNLVEAFELTNKNIKKFKLLHTAYSLTSFKIYSYLNKKGKKEFYKKIILN